MTPKEMATRLRRAGFQVGLRNPRLNTDHRGDFMVAEAHDPATTTRDARNGPWCIVGNDLDALVIEAYEVHIA